MPNCAGATVGSSNVVPVPLCVNRDVGRGRPLQLSHCPPRTGSCSFSGGGSTERSTRSRAAGFRPSSSSAETPPTPSSSSVSARIQKSSFWPATSTSASSITRRMVLALRSCALRRWRGCRCTSASCRRLRGMERLASRSTLPSAAPPCCLCCSGVPYSTDYFVATWESRRSGQRSSCTTS